MPTICNFIVTHNIEEAVLLADRVIVLGCNPARIRSDFEINIPQYRDRKSPRFLAYVDFIHKALTKPDCGCNGDPDGFERSRDALSIRGQPALAETYPAGHFPVFGYGNGDCLGRSLECQHCG